MNFQFAAFFVVCLNWNFPMCPNFNKQSNRTNQSAEWSKWSQCNATCGFGVQNRMRSCLRNKPADCVDYMEKICLSNKMCPKDGGWSEWSTWSCGATYGIALEKRDRTCDNPPAAFGGRKCSDGNQSWREETNHEWMPPRPANYTQHSIELRDCSSLSECDLDNDFSPAVEQLIRIAERHRPASSYILSSNQSVTFVCNTSLYEQALRVLSLPVNASQLKIEWYLNSQIMMSPDRSIQVNDSYAGVWACVVAPQGSVRRRLIVDFHLIAVRSLLNISAQNASDMSNALVCHSWPLQAIRSYSNVSIVWLRNDVEVERHVALEWSEPNSPALLQNKPLDPSKVKLMEENANTANASSSPLASQVREYKCVVREWNEDGISKEWITSHYQINWTDFKSDDYKHLSIFYGYMFWLLILVVIFSHFLITTRNT